MLAISFQCDQKCYWMLQIQAAGGLAKTSNSNYFSIVSHTPNDYLNESLIAAPKEGWRKGQTVRHMCFVLCNKSLQM